MSDVHFLGSVLMKDLVMKPLLIPGLPSRGMQKLVLSIQFENWSNQVMMSNLLTSEQLYRWYTGVYSSSSGELRRWKICTHHNLCHHLA